MQTDSSDVHDCMVAHRKAKATVQEETLRLEFNCKTGDFTKFFNAGDIEHVVYCSETAWIRFTSPVRFMPNLKHARDDMVIHGKDVVERIVHDFGGTSLNGVTSYKSRANSATLHLAASNSFVATTARSAHVFNDVEAIIFQRTGGGMQTCDVLICARGNPVPFVVEYIEHDDMDAMVPRLVEAVRIYDYGPDPVPLGHLSTCHREEGSWTAVINCLDDSEADVEVDDPNDSDYDSQAVGYSTESSYMESDDDGSDT